MCANYQLKQTLAPLSVLRLSPINPGILVPGQTLALLPPWPMFPPLLWVLVTPWDAGMPWKPHLFITPWNPRNFLQPINAHFGKFAYRATSTLITWVRKRRCSLRPGSEGRWVEFQAEGVLPGRLRILSAALWVARPTLWKFRNTL
jgi:hypothetical protein